MPGKSTEAMSFEDLYGSTHSGLDTELAAAFEQTEALEFEVYVPDGAGPHGVLVYISPKPGAAIPDAWCEVMDRLNLVWVGAKDSGNEIAVARRAGLALLAPAVAAQVARIESGRQYLTGFSGGGRVASMLMQTHAEVFSGSIYICGANPILLASTQQIDAIRTTPMIFLTGTGDFNLDDTQMALSTYRTAGVTGAILDVVDGLGHALPGADAMGSALSYLIDNS